MVEGKPAGTSGTVPSSQIHSPSDPEVLCCTAENCESGSTAWFGMFGESELFVSFVRIIYTDTTCGCVHVFDTYMFFSTLMYPEHALPEGFRAMDLGRREAAVIDPTAVTDYHDHPMGVQCTTLHCYPGFASDTQTGWSRGFLFLRREKRVSPTSTILIGDKPPS